jgi:GTP-binding protein Era
VALVGKPNVGKSTLMNAIVGQKVSIVSNKPQTTRRRILGIATTESYQIAFLDTPGVHVPHTQLDKAMLDAARGALDAVDVVVVVGEGGHHPGELDKEVAKMVSPGGKPVVPVIVCINKMDQLKPEHVLPYVEAYQKLFGTQEYMLTTASRGRNVDKLTELIVAHLPQQEALYPADEVTDASSRFLAGEFVREKILALTRQEVPYATAVIVDEWSEEPSGLVRISATILVEKASQRGILIGKQGAFLKKIGESARLEIEELIGSRVFLGLHIRVQPDWRMNPRVLHELEYSE